MPQFERMVVRSGITLVKYWFSITDEEQQFRFRMRIHDPLKQWKLSPMDAQWRALEQYTEAKEEMHRTHIAEAPWWVVEAVDKKRARLNCIAYLLKQMPYARSIAIPWVLPHRVHDARYRREQIPPEMYVPAQFRSLLISARPAAAGPGKGSSVPCTPPADSLFFMAKPARPPRLLA